MRRGHRNEHQDLRSPAAVTAASTGPMAMRLWHTSGNEAARQAAKTDIITHDPVIESILEPYRTALGPSLYSGYRSHAYRMVHFARALTAPARDRDERLAVMAAFHDLPFCLSGNLDYLDAAADLADAWLNAHGRAAWREDVRRMISHHHKIRPYHGPSAPLVEATRKADWIDVTFGVLRFGLPRGYVQDVDAAFPLDGFYPGPAWRMVARYAVSNIRRPLPNLRW
jgi:hypothetical protein